MILSLLLLTFFLNPSEAQNNHVEMTFIDTFFYTVHSFEYDTSNHFFLTGTTGSLNHTPFIARVDSNGSIVKKRTLLPDSKYYNADPISIVQLDSGHTGVVLLATGSFDEGPTKYFLYKLDPDFNKLWVDSSDGNPGYRHHVLNAGGGKMTWLDGNELTTYDGQGNVIATDSISFLVDISRSYQHDTVLFTQNSTLYQFDISTNTVNDSVQLDHEILDLKVDADNIIVATANSIQYLDGQLTSLYAHNFPEFHTRADLAANSSSITILRKPDTSEPVNKLWKFNKQLQLQSQHVHHMPPLQLHNISFIGGRLFSAGINRTQLWLQSWNNLSMENETDDISLDSMHYEIVSVDSMYPFPQVTYDLYATIGNQGHTTIDSCMIIERNKSLGWNFYFRSFKPDTLNILPSSSSEIYLGRFSHSSPGTLQPCFVVLGPNGRTDTNYANNSYCIDIAITGIRNPEVRSLKVRPNPSSGKFYFELPDHLSSEIKLTVRNINGQLIARQNMSPNNPVLDLHSVEAGIYFATIRHNKEVYFGKLIKQ